VTALVMVLAILQPSGVSGSEQARQLTVPRDVVRVISN
jgi:hypothetical protein